MDSQLVLLLTTIITTTISALISGIFGVIGNQIQSQSSKLYPTETPKVLLPPGVVLPGPASKSRNFLSRFAMIIGGGVIVGIILGVILQNTQPSGSSPSRDTLVKLAYGMAAFVIIGIVVYGIVLSGNQKLESRKWSITIAVSVTLILVLTASYFMLSAFLEQRTVYFIVDTSASTQDVSREIFNRVNLGIEQIPDNVNVGLAVFGGSIGGQSGCNDITEIVKPAPKKESVPRINQAISKLSDITPSGNNILQNAVIYALSRLAGRKGVQQIFVITSSLDSICGIPDRKFIDNIALLNKTDFELIVVSVGVLGDDRSTLTAFADRYINIETAEKLSPIIADVMYTPPSLYDIYKQVYPSSGQ